MNRVYCAIGRIACYGLAILTLGCAQPQPAPDTRAADEAAIRKAEADWSKDTATKQASAMAAYYDEAGSVLPPNAPIATGKEAIGKVWEDMFALPGFSLHFESSKVEVARSGDIGYSEGSYELQMNDPKGNPMTDTGKFVTVWKKQADGSWKALADIFNSDLPVPPPPK